MKDQKIGGYTLSCKRRKFKLAEVVSLLKLTYWAKDREPKVTERSLRHSYPYGVFDPKGRLVGLLRVTSDKATVYYLSDVVVAEEERGKGLGIALVRYALADKKVCRGKGMLLTQTAAGLYAKEEFHYLNDRLMVREAARR
jgi:GNAT superfamily N-acetyltransferase